MSKKERNLAIQKSLNMLQVGLYHEAIKIVAKYRADNPEERGMVVGSNPEEYWKNYEPTHREIEILDYIFSRTPQIFEKHITDDNFLLDVRYLSALLFLWGKVDSQFYNSHEQWLFAQLLQSHCLVIYELIDLHKKGYTHIEVMNCNDFEVCNPCLELAAKNPIPISELPELPLHECENDTFCRCWIRSSSKNRIRN